MLNFNTTRAMNVLKILLGILAILILLMLLYGSIAKVRLLKGNPPPGELVSIGEHKIHIHCVGTGTPTVILEAGLKDFSVFWSHVQPEVAKATRVCAYDRAGYGWSEISANPRTIENATSELQALMANAEIAPPFVLVGHSYGGAIVRLYASLYPDDVAGLVLVDAAHEDLFIKIPEFRDADNQVLKLFKSLKPLNKYGMLAMIPGNIPNRSLPAEGYEQYKAVLATTNYFEVAINESLLHEENLNTLRELTNSRQGDIPLIVVSRGEWDLLPNESQETNQRAWLAWQRMQSELLALSSNSKQIIATQSGHEIQLQQPEVIIEAIFDVVVQINNEYE